MDNAAVILYWVRFGIVMLVLLSALISLFRRSRRKAARHDLVVGLIGVLLVGGATYVGRASADYVLSGIGAGVGLVIGLGLGRMRPVAALLAALASVFAAIMILFGEPEAVGVGLAAVAIAAVIPLGQGIRGTGVKEPQPQPAPQPVPQPQPAPQPVPQPAPQPEPAPQPVPPPVE